MRKMLLAAVAAALLAALLAVTWTAQAAPPPQGPPGLAKAIAAQERHNPQLLTTRGVVGTAVGLAPDGRAVVRVFTLKSGAGRLPAFVDGVPVVAQATGKLMALKRRPRPNDPPVVAITSPAQGAQFASGELVSFAATAQDKQNGDLSMDLVWTSSIDGPLGSAAGFSRPLNDGMHTITASVADAQGAIGQASVSIAVGTVSHQTTDLWERPVPIGVSTGNYQSVSAGTIACRVRDAAGNLYALSNTHVFAPNDITGQSEIGDIVTQPGLYDVSTHVYDANLRIGAVAAYKSINGSIFATNQIDAAIARIDAGALGTSTPMTLGGYGAPNSLTRPAAVNMAVQKFGRSTQLTHGIITGINATMIVAYADDWYAFFTGQIVVETPGAFIQPGDSGSLLVTDDAAANPVGLVFSGNADGTMTLANPIDGVLQYFHVTVDGT